MGKGNDETRAGGWKGEGANIERAKWGRRWLIFGTWFWAWIVSSVPATYGMVTLYDGLQRVGVLTRYFAGG